MKKGVTLIELVIVLMVVVIVATVFHTLIGQTTESGAEIMGKKESYQQMRDALKQIAEDVRYNIRGGPHHNLGVWNDPATTRWQETSLPCTGSLFSYFPDRTNFTTMHTFRWVFIMASGNRPTGYYLARIDNGTLPSRVYAGWAGSVGGGSTGALTVRYFDDDDVNDGPAEEILIGAGGSLTHDQARRVTRVVLSLTLSRWNKPVTLVESIYIRERGAPLQEGI